MFVYARIRDFLQHEFLFCSIQCMLADEHTIICGYSVRTGAMNRTPMECALRLFMCNQCLFHVHPLGYVIAFIQFGADGRNKSAPTPTECTLLLFMYNQCLFHEHVIFTHVHKRLPTCTHCRGRFIVPTYHGMYGVDNRVQPMFYPRTPIVMCGCIYTIRCRRAR